MLPTFVIGLREGLEAALIVGIVAAFLKQRGRRDLLRLVWLGVAVAVLLCLSVGIGLHVYSADLPQKQQEGLETVVGFIAVAMVTYMVIWMRRHSRDLKKQLEGAATSAMESGSGMALVAMAFLAVFREGFETAVFLLAAFDGSSNPKAATTGAVLGLAVAFVLGYGIYRGGVRINLSKFFRATGAVLVLVAAGLIFTALHTAHEAGWLNIGQSTTVDLTWLVQPGSVQSSLLTGILGLQPKPVVIELVGWLVYLVPVGLYVVWPPGRRMPSRSIVRTGAVVAAVSAVAAIVLTVLVPARPATTSAYSVDVGSGSPIRVTTTAQGANRVQLTAEGMGTSTLSAAGHEDKAGRDSTVFTRSDVTATNPSDLPKTVNPTQLAAMNGGRLPLGVTSQTGVIALAYRTTRTDTVWLDAISGRLLDVSVVQQTSATASWSGGAAALDQAKTTSVNASAAWIARAATAARGNASTLDRRNLLHGFARVAWVVAVLGAVAAAVGGFGGYRARRRRRDESVSTIEPRAVAVTS